MEKKDLWRGALVFGLVGLVLFVMVHVTGARSIRRNRLLLRFPSEPEGDTT